MTVVKKKIFAALLVVLLVVAYALPNGFHLHLCLGEDGHSHSHGHWHWHVKPANQAFSNHAPELGPEQPQLFSRAYDHCCADLATDNAKNLRSLTSVSPGRDLAVFSPLPLAWWPAQALPLTGKHLLSLSHLPVQAPFQTSFLRTVVLLI